MPLRGRGADWGMGTPGLGVNLVKHRYRSKFPDDGFEVSFADNAAGAEPAHGACLAGGEQPILARIEVAAGGSYQGGDSEMSSKEMTSKRALTSSMSSVGAPATSVRRQTIS